MAHKVFGKHDTLCGDRYDVEEPCPYCDGLIAVKRDYDLPHLETICPDCHHRMMICAMCEADCDWSPENGCCMDIKHTIGKEN